MIEYNKELIEKIKESIINGIFDIWNNEEDDACIEIEDMHIILESFLPELPHKLKGVPCKRCGEKPEIRTHCTLHEVRCANRKCPKPTTVGSHTRLECAVDSWNRKQCPHENKLPNQDLGHTICQDCGQIL